MIRIPSDIAHKWHVAHGRDIVADIVNTRNMDFDKEGYAKLANPTIALYTTDDNANFGTPVSIFSDGTQYYWITTGGYFTTISGSSFTRTSDTGNEPTSSAGSDGIYFNGLLTVTGTTTVKTYAASTWTDRSITTSSSYPHPMCVVEHLNQFAVGNGNVVKTYDTSYSNQATLTLPAEYIVVWMRWRQNNLYIGTRNIIGSGAKMFIWNGSGSSAQTAFGVQADWMFSGEEYMSSIVTVTSAGQILRFNGGGFDELEHFPVYETPYSWTPPSSPSSSLGKVASRGMASHGDVLYINIDGSLNRNGLDYPGNHLHTQPSGLWELKPNVGLYHKAGFVYTKYQSLTVTDMNSSILSVGGTVHDLSTGDPVFLRTLTGLSGIIQGQQYYAVVVSTTTFSLALTPGDAIAGNVITLSGIPTSDTVDIPSRVQIGAVNDVIPGAVSRFTNLAFYDFYGTEIMFGGACDNAAGTTKRAAMSLGQGKNIGSITTAPIYSQNAKETFQKVWQKTKGIFQDADTIKVKYKTRTRLGFPSPTYSNSPGKATWVTGTSFTVNNTYKSISLAQVDDEVVIISGVGAGRISKISTISNAGTTYTITLADTIPNVSAGNVGDVIVDNWTDLTTISNASNDILDDISQIPEGGTGSWIQYKFVVSGTRVAIKELQFITSPHIPSQ